MSYFKWLRENIGVDNIMLIITGSVFFGVVVACAYKFSNIDFSDKRPFEETLYKWEYQAHCPSTTTPDELLAIENKLRQEGYTRIVMRARYDETWTDVKRAGTEIFATRQLPEITNATGTTEED